MERTLAAFAASAAPLAERLRLARDLARAVAELHTRGRTHGALRPGAVVVVDGRAVVLAPPPGEPPPLAGAGFDAPEVARGARPTRRSDAFSAGALAYLALTGRAPFDSDDPLERTRRVLHEEAQPVRRHAPDLPLAADGCLAALLEKRPRRRASAADLARAMEALRGAVEGETRDGRAMTLPGNVAATATATATASRSPTSTATATSTSTSTPTPTPTPTTTTTPISTAIPPEIPTPTASQRILHPSARLARLRARLTPAGAALFLAIPLVALAVLTMPRGDGPLEREVAELLERRELAAARERLDRAAKAAPGDPLVEKLRGDLACARGAPGECLRRYRVALAARPRLREDPALRANVRRLLSRQHACSTRRAAAHLLGALRDPESLPALEAARRSGGIFAAFCTGDSIDRAIAATRAELPR